MHRAYGAQQPAVRFWKDYKAVTRDLKAIYRAPTEEAGQQALEAFASAWDSRYPQISRSWQANWTNGDVLRLPGRYPQSHLHNQRHRVAEQRNPACHQKRKVFPTDDSVKKVVWLAIRAASQKWTMPAGLAYGNEPLYYRVR